MMGVAAFHAERRGTDVEPEALGARQAPVRDLDDLLAEIAQNDRTPAGGGQHDLSEYPACDL